MPVYIQDRGFNSFASNMIKLPVSETKWSSLLARTCAHILYISIWIFDFGPVKLTGLSRNGSQGAFPWKPGKSALRTRLRWVVAKLVRKKLVSDQSSDSKEMFQGCIWMRSGLNKNFGPLLYQVIFPPLQRASLRREGLRYNWKQSMSMGSNRSRLQLYYKLLQLGFSKPRTTFEYTYTNTSMSKVSRGLDRPSPKLVDMPLAWAGWP